MRVLKVGEFAIPLQFQQRVLNMEVGGWIEAKRGFKGEGLLYSPCCLFPFWFLFLLNQLISYSNVCRGGGPNERWGNSFGRFAG